MATIFDKIIEGSLPCHKVYEDEEFLAFLDVSPRVKGHTIVIPKDPVNYIFDMEDEAYTSLMLTSKKVARLLKEKLKCKRVCVGVYGFEVGHVHIHLLPAESLSQIPLPNVNKNEQKSLEETLQYILN